MASIQFRLVHENEAVGRVEDWRADVRLRWLSGGRVPLMQTFWMLSGNEAESESLPKTAHGVTLRILPRPDLIAFAMRSQNWAQIVPYRISFMRHADRPLQKDILGKSVAQAH